MSSGTTLTLTVVKAGRGSESLRFGRTPSATDDDDLPLPVSSIELQLSLGLILPLRYANLCVRPLFLTLAIYGMHKWRV